MISNQFQGVVFHPSYLALFELFDGHDAAAVLVTAPQHYSVGPLSHHAQNLVLVHPGPKRRTAATSRQKSDARYGGKSARREKSYTVRYPGVVRKRQESIQRTALGASRRMCHALRFVYQLPINQHPSQMMN